MRFGLLVQMTGVLGYPQPLARLAREARRPVGTASSSGTSSVVTRPCALQSLILGSLWRRLPRRPNASASGQW